MPSHSRSKKKNTDPVFVPQIQTQLQSSSWVQSAETMNPDLEVPELQMEPEPREGFGQGFGHRLGNISISAPATPPESPGLPTIQMKGDAPNIQCKLTPEQVKHANRIRKARGLPLLPVEQAGKLNNIEEAIGHSTANQPPANQPPANQPPANQSVANQPVASQSVASQPTEEQNIPENQQSPEILLNNGKLSLQELKDFLQSTTLGAIASLNPQSETIRNILKYPLGQSWHTAKHELAEGDEKAKALMGKIWEFRKWHHRNILERAKTRVNQLTTDENGLKNWSAAGSETLTSDIDVNLKGTETELAVKIFNEEFKKDGWDYESGVVYDVNVYALDFMHTFGGVEVDGHQLTQKEGKRQNQIQGGFKESILSQQDKEQQDEWSLVKVRLYISNPVQWEEYAEAAGLSKKKKESIEAKYQNYVKEISEEMSKQANISVDAAEQSEDDMASGITGLNSTAEKLIHQQLGGKSSSGEVLAENLLMGSSNRVYERKLQEVSQLRKELKDAIARYNNMVEQGDNGGTAFGGVTGLEMLNGYIEVKLKALRKLVSESALFSNEAYVTDAAVYHAVVGLQGGNAIEQSKAESMQAVTENMGDALKEISRHNDTLGEAAFKSAKYIWRMADAAKNMGFSTISGVNDLYEVGYSIANEIKGQGNVDEKQASEAKMNTIGITTGSQLVAKVLTVGTAVRRQYTQLTKEQQTSLSQPTPSGKKTKNTN
ncbi:hypothetical protein [Planktothricoides raciborskii]|uniref:Uncharacterized protein n=1 Tax=Planktothricoides raciborskii FACHB-1370 TaxID=2949576 RepID=A0ABR8EA55_9CYAN|nr:hypothetical protein [Planktothricoides raciborskii]MBD2542506.1 hypothetical protein [Planktothricoides raciborskii FACHB-1370]MBD2580963.1 hypothetical protein [Planktothricoides raciborskii FACHB-1261]